MLPHINDFLLNLQAKHYSVGTVHDYERYLVAFNRFLDERNISFDEINKQTITSYKRYLALRGRGMVKPGNHSDKPLATCTINYKLIGLRVYLRYLINIGYPCPLAPEAVENLKIVQKQPQLPGLEELIKLIEAPSPQASIRELRDKTILETLFNTGLRVSELISLDRDQIDLGRRQFSLKGKSDKLRKVFLSDTVARWIGRYLQSRRDNFKPLFVRHSGEIDNRQNGERMRLTVRSIQRIVNRYAERCGLSIKATPQTLRRCFATYLAGESSNPVPLQVLYGHEVLNDVTRFIYA